MAIVDFVLKENGTSYLNRKTKNNGNFVIDIQRIIDANGEKKKSGVAFRGQSHFPDRILLLKKLKKKLFIF